MNIQVKPGGKIRILRLEVEDGRYEGEEGTVEFIDRSDSSTAPRNRPIHRNRAGGIILSARPARIGRGGTVIPIRWVRP